ncbi:DUF2244 domain-containing protein [Marinobacteraceae bacterium S3BR75-40.1]
MVRHVSDQNGIRLILTPNRSLGWPGNVLVWAGIAAVSLGVAVGMSAVGAWPILPFAGLELAALAGGFYYTARHCFRQEVLVLSPRTLRLEKGRYRKEAEWNLPRHSSRIYLNEPHHPWEPPRLFLKHRETEVPLAAFLNLHDVEALVTTLEYQGVPIQRMQARQSLWL